MPEGWIRLYRSVMNDDWLSDPFTRGQAWVDLLMLANHKPGKIRKRGILIDVKRGQVGYSEESLAERWQWSRKKLRRFLNELISSQQISREAAQQNKNLSLLITITNYEKYQGEETTDHATEDTTGDTTEEQQKNNRRYRNKNVKNEKNIKPKPSGEFDQFYAEYPRKANRTAALKAWNKYNGEMSALFPVIMEALRLQKRTVGSALNPKSGPDYIPYPASWINSQRWKDEIKAADQKPASLTPDQIKELVS